MDDFLLFSSTFYTKVKLLVFPNSPSDLFGGFSATGMWQLKFLLAKLKGFLTGERGWR